MIEQSLLISALALRRAIGVIGIALPIIIPIGAWKWLASLSAYYHTNMRDVFVGALCAAAIFLLCYRGYEVKDRNFAMAAGVGAIGTALLPTALSAKPAGWEQFASSLHWTFAAIFLASLTYIALGLFTKTAIGATPTPQKLKRNSVYRVCGWTMAACLVLLALYFWLLPDAAKAALEPLHPVFVLEAVAVISFGIAWLIKGEALLGDKPQAA